MQIPEFSRSDIDFVIDIFDPGVLSHAHRKVHALEDKSYVSPTIGQYTESNI
jgi:hypothetical protein